MVPSWNFTVRKAAAVAAEKADALDSAAIVALTAGGDKPSAVLPSAEMNRRLPASTAICPVRWDHVAAMTERYHALDWRSANVADSRRKPAKGYRARNR